MSTAHRSLSRTQSRTSGGDANPLGFRPATSLLTSPRRATTPNRTAPGTARSKERPPPKQLGEVIEISSDEDEEIPPPRDNTILALRKEVERLKQEQASYKYKLEKSQSELAIAQQQLQAPPQPAKDKVVLSFSQVEDSISCDICSTRMWQPHILPDCGHTFCQSCLQDWFGTTLAQYMQAHPHYNPARRNQPYANNWGGNNWGGWNAYNHPDPGPQYTCPSCRKTVTNRPVEDFTLKALVRTIAGATGESSPKKPQLPPSHSRGKTRAASLKTNDIWEGFFPATPAALPYNNMNMNVW